MSTFTKVQKNISPLKIEALLIKLFDTLQLWIERHQQRKQLSQLNEHLLKDIGISHSEVWHETQKPFWRG